MPYFTNEKLFEEWLKNNGGGGAAIGGVVGGSPTASGAPTLRGTLGAIYFRTDTPTTADQRIYICTTAGADGAAVWTGIL